MRGGERLWCLVVCVLLGLLTFSTNGHPFIQRDAAMGINDDPVESQALSLSERIERDTTSSNNKSSSNEGTSTSTNNSPRTTTASTSPGLKTTSKTPEIPKNVTATNGTKVSHQNGSTVNSSVASTTKNVSINATIQPTATRTAIQHSSVNTTLNPSQTTTVIPTSRFSVKLNTSASLVKPSVTMISPAESHSTSQNDSSNVTHSVLTTMASSAVNLNMSTIIVKPVSTNSVNSLGPSSTATATQNPPSSSKLPPIHGSQSSTGAPPPQSSIGPSTLISTGKPSQKFIEASSTKGTTRVQSTSVTKLPSTTPDVSTPESTKASMKVTTTKKAQEKSPTMLSTSGPVSTLPPTTEAKVHQLTTTTKIPSAQLTTGVTTGATQLTKGVTTKGARKDDMKLVTKTSAPLTSGVPSTAPKKPTTNMKEATKKITTEEAHRDDTKQTTKAGAPLTSSVPSTAPKEPTTNMKQITKKITTKEATTKKATAVKTKTNNQNNDEGQMPPPDQGREAVLWDFIIPVAIGTGVALAIALGVILVRTCRRRRLIKVRFGGKPSHPRLLNNDLINLLAESDDEEE